MATSNSNMLNSDIPQVTGAPIADPKTGLITQPWLYLVIQLWRRTGGATGNSGTADDVPFEDILAPAPGIDPFSAALSTEASMFMAAFQQAVKEAVAIEMTMARGEPPMQNAPISNEITMGQV